MAERWKLIYVPKMMKMKNENQRIWCFNFKPQYVPQYKPQYIRVRQFQKHRDDYS